MKLNIHSFAVVLLGVLLIFTSNSSARKLAIREREAVVNLNQESKPESLVKMETTNSFDKLMGLEACENEDEECLKRRVTAEAHLDYIYTQQHKP